MYMNLQGKDASNTGQTYLIKGPCIVETAPPDFIHSTLG